MRTISKIAASMSALALSLALSGVALAAATTGTIKGMVTGADGKPAASMSVKVMPPGMGGKKGEPKGEPKAEPKADKGEKKGRPMPVAEGTTDAKGMYEIKDVPAGDYQIMAGDRATGMGREKVTVKAGETATVDITIKAPKAK